MNHYLRSEHERGSGTAGALGGGVPHGIHGMGLAHVPRRRREALEVAGIRSHRRVVVAVLQVLLRAARVPHLPSSSIHDDATILMDDDC